MSSKRGAPRKNCCTEDHWVLAAKLLSLGFIILTLVIVLVQAASNPDSIQRYNVRTLQFWGPLTLDSNNNRITYRFRLYNLTSPITSIHLKGPIVIATLEGPIAAALCGTPSPNSCNTIMPGEIPLEMVNEVWDGVHLVAQDVRHLIREVRADPDLYYVVACNAEGCYRSELQGIMGTP